MIDQEFGVRYHPCHVWKLLSSLGWSCQKPERRALQRDEEEIAHWKRYRWPHIKKTERLGAHLVFLDESGFLLIPNVTRTWAPKGQTPLFYHLYKQDRISALSGLSVSPKRRRLALYLRFRRRNLTGLDVRAFLKSLLQHLEGAGGSALSIGEPSTDGKKCSNFFLVIRDCTFITFPPMHRNSTRQNMFGIRLTMPFPTVRQRTWRSLKGCFVIRCGAYGAPKNFSGPVSMLPIYHGYGENESFHYLCKTQ